MYRTTFAREDGLPAGANAITQTPDGYIWVGTASGLYRFDGARFERIAAGRLLSADITGLLAAASGDLWIGYLGGVSRLHGDAVENFPPNAGGPPGNITRLKEAPHGGGIWAGANAGPMAARRSSSSSRPPSPTCRVARELPGSGRAAPRRRARIRVPRGR